LGKVIEKLFEIDKVNRESNANLFAHIFLYEPSEAKDLQEIIGFYLNDEIIRNGLLNIVRIFPPEEVIPEPEYKGVHHLPATALKSVFTQIYTLPVRVSYDLARISGALQNAKRKPEFTYSPNEEFKREFSSRLNIELCQRIRQEKNGSFLISVNEDIINRLKTINALQKWLITENQLEEVPFLRLKKKPFMFQTDFNPLTVSSLDILRAQEVLENRISLMSNLIELSNPYPKRRDKFKCFAKLTLENIIKRGKYYELLFRVPQDSQQADIKSSDMGLILTNDDPDVRLDPSIWSEYRVKIKPGSELYKNRTLKVQISERFYESQFFQSMIREEQSQDSWFIDLTYVDTTSRMMQQFINYLASGEN
jgi:hypothetical protein